MFALDAGEDAGPYLDAIVASTSLGGLLPEQVWDSAPIESRRLAPGKPSGSATPLVWAHAEYLKLLVASTKATRADRLDSVASRYQERVAASTAHVRGEADIATDAETVIIEGGKPFRLHYGTNGWNTPRDVDSAPLGLGRHGVRLSRADLDPTVTSLEWTTFDVAIETWENVDHRITLNPSPVRARRIKRA